MHDPALDVTIVVPTIPARSRLLQRAIGSTARQTHPAAAVVISNDVDGVGAWENRNRGIAHVRTPWCAFLDDDDELLPHHLETLLGLATSADVGLAFGWFDVVGGTDPFPQHRGRPFDPANPHIVPITYLVRTEVLFEAMLAVGGFQPDPAATGAWDVQDQPLFVAMAELAGTAHTDRITWLWHHHTRNTSGLPSRVVP
jgi:hypothetical protein